MTKKTFILFCLCSVLPFLKSKAQESPFAGTFSVSDFEVNYKECPFDNDAAAVVFLDDALSTYDEDYQLITYHHVKLKILKDKGVDYGNIIIPFYSDGNFETISGVDGTVYNNEGSPNSRKLDAKSVYRKKVNEFWSEVKFDFPGLKAGSILEYYYTSTKKNYGGLKNWVFQEEIPVLKSHYLLTILPNAEFAYAVQKSPDLPIDVKSDRLNGQISFEMDNIPGLRNEKYIDSKNDYFQKVSFQLSKFQDEHYMTTWEKVNYEMIRDGSFYGQLKKNIPGTDDFIKGIMQDSSEFDKMKKVYDYVRNNMAWNEVYSKYSIDGIKKAWDKKTGTSGDLNLLLIDLLREAGVDADPMLVSERSNGKVDPKIIMVDQFNTVYACVAINNKQYYLDATEKYNSCRLTPYPILNTTGFIVKQPKGTLNNIVDTAALYKEDININASVNKDGILNGAFSMESFDYAKGYRLQNLSTKSVSENQKIITGNMPGLNISEIKTENKDDDSVALITKNDFSLALNHSSEYYFLPSNFLTGLNENPFISDNRFSNINFGYKQLIQLTMHIKVDTSFTTNALPKSIKLRDSEGGLVFIRNVLDKKQQNEMIITSTLEINKNLYPVSQYNVIKDFYKKLFDLLNEQIVLKKNNQI